MMATTHALVGCLIWQAIPNPYIAVPIIIGSHVLMDVIPHWDFGTDYLKRSVKETGMLAIGDTLFAMVVSVLLFGNSIGLFGVLMAVSAGNILDWMEAPWFLFLEKIYKKDTFWKPFISFYHTLIYLQEKYLHTRDTFPHGVFTQIGFVLFIWILLNGR